MIRDFDAILVLGIIVRRWHLSKESGRVYSLRSRFQGCHWPKTFTLASAGRFRRAKCLHVEESEGAYGWEGKVEGRDAPYEMKILGLV